MSVGLGESRGGNITREEVFSNIGYKWNEIRDKTKGELIVLVTKAITVTVKKLFEEKKIDGVIAAGGVQNSTVAMTAMQQLPFGFPKVIASTIASGQKPFASLIGEKDIVVIPSICDFTGLNMLTKTILTNACACVSGMAINGGQILKKPNRPVVGVSLMGITNDGCCAAIEELTRLGIETMGFHTTGAGGSIMEKMALDGTIDGILDMTTHEITAEYFGGGFSFGAKNRLIAPLEAGIPMVISTGGLDFVDFDKDNFPPRMDERKYNMHNERLAHIKILPDEAVEVGMIFADRLNKTKNPVKLVLPTNGMRKNTKPGENLYVPETDKNLLGTIVNNINSNIEVIHLDGNLNDKDWGVRIANIMADEMRNRGYIFAEKEADK